MRRRVFSAAFARERGGLLTQERGASVVIAISLIAAILFFTIGTATTVMSAIKNTSHSKKALQAEYAAQGAVELVRHELKDMSSGWYEDKDGELYLDENTDEDAVKADYSISTEDDSLETLYIGQKGNRSIPVLGTGDAGNNCYKDFTYEDLAMEPDHPCNWNKLYYGDSVLVPLFVQAGPGKAKGIGDLGVTIFFTKLRAPCVDGVMEASCKRYSVGVTPGIISGYDSGEVLVNWQVFGDCADGLCSVTGIPDTANSAFQELYLNDGTVVVSSESKVMDSYESDEEGPVDGKLMNFFKSTGPWFGNDLDRPYLKLSYVREASPLNDGSIPYLEYQLMYELFNDAGLAASYLITVDGYSEGFKYSLNGVQSMESDLFDFAVQN